MTISLGSVLLLRCGIRPETPHHSPQHPVFAPPTRCRYDPDHKQGSPRRPRGHEKPKSGLQEVNPLSSALGKLAVRTDRHGFGRGTQLACNRSSISSRWWWGPRAESVTEGWHEL